MKKLALVVAVAAVTACESNGTLTPSNDATNNDTAVPANFKIAASAVDPGYTTSDIIIVEQDANGYTVTEQLVNTTSPEDIGISTFGDEIYRLDRDTDSITRFTFDESANSLSADWQYTVLTGESDANPYKFVKVNATKAYVIRYGSRFIWEVNPSSNSSGGFLQARIDLANYADPANAGIPLMTDAVLVDDQLFVLLERLQNWKPIENSSIVVIDTTDNSIVDTNIAQAGVQAIALPHQNSQELTLDNDNNIIVASRGNPYYGEGDSIFTGGLALVNSTNYQVTELLDDNATSGNLTQVDVAPNGDIYFIGSQAWQNDKLFKIDAEDTEFAFAEITLATQTIALSDVAADATHIYVAQGASSDGNIKAGFSVIDREDHSNIEVIETTFNPTQFVLTK